MIDLEKFKNVELIYNLEHKGKIWYRSKISLKKYKNEIDGKKYFIMLECDREIKSLNNITTASEFLSLEKVCEKNNWSKAELYSILIKLFENNNWKFTKIYIKGCCV